jgi:hypothetical protein
MEGQVTAYSGTSLTVNVDLTSATAQSPQVPPVLPNYLGGLTLANDATTPNTVLDISPGGATSDDNSTLMVLTSGSFTKNCNAAWAVGSGNGALDSGSAIAAGTWYHVFLIERIDTGVVDVLISTNATTPTMPINYTKKRRIGSIRTGASSIMLFSQFGDKFLWKTPIVDYGNYTLPTVLTALVLTVPPGIKTEAQISIYFSVSTASYFTMWPLDQTGVGLNIPQGNITMNGWASGAILTVALSMRTNTTQNVNIQASAAAPGVYLTTQGWIDYRGK